MSLISALLSLPSPQSDDQSIVARWPRRFRYEKLARLPLGRGGAHQQSQADQAATSSHKHHNTHSHHTFESIVVVCLREVGSKRWVRPCLFHLVCCQPTCRTSALGFTGYATAQMDPYEHRTRGCFSNENLLAALRSEVSKLT